MIPLNKRWFTTRPFRPLEPLLTILFAMGWVCAIALFSFVGPAIAAGGPTADPAAQLFETQCAGCHPRGGNIIRRGKTLKLRALQRNQLDSVAAIATLVTEGKNNMSAYGDQLTEEDIMAVSTYVWDQAQQNWR